MSNDLAKAEFSFIKEFLNDVATLKELDESFSQLAQSRFTIPESFKKLQQLQPLREKVYSQATSVTIALEKLFHHYSQNNFL